MGSISYTYAKVAIQFPPRFVGGIKRKGDRRISKLESKRGHGGGKGRVHRQVHGSCSGHHYGSNRHDPDNEWFHGVNCSDFRRRFSGEEFQKAGIDGCLYILNKIKSDKDTRYIQKVQKGRETMGRS